MAASCTPTKGYDGDATRRKREAKGSMPNTPPKPNRRRKTCFSPLFHRDRNAIERRSCRLRDCRPIATRHDRLAVNSPAAARLAATVSTDHETGS